MLWAGTSKGPVATPCCHLCPTPMAPHRIYPGPGLGLFAHWCRAQGEELYAVNTALLRSSRVTDRKDSPAAAARDFHTGCRSSRRDEADKRLAAVVNSISALIW